MRSGVAALNTHHGAQPSPGDGPARGPKSRWQVAALSSIGSQNVEQQRADLIAQAAYLLAMLAVALGPLVQEQMALLAIGAVVLGGGFLVSIGLPQWLVLRRHLRHAGCWAPANALAWPLGVEVPFVALALVPDAAAVLDVGGDGHRERADDGAACGRATGLALLWLVRSELR